MRQHLTAVQAAAAVCGGAVNGAEIGSQSLDVRAAAGPRGQISLRRRHRRQHHAGAANRAAGAADRRRAVRACSGRRHAQPVGAAVRFSADGVSAAGQSDGPAGLGARFERHGFYPAGGGRFTVTIEPCPSLAGFDLAGARADLSRSHCALVANLPDHIADREVERILEKLTWDPSCGASDRVQAHGPGNVAFVEIASEHVTEVFTAFGRTGVRAEKVADEVVRAGPRLPEPQTCPSGPTWPINSCCR